VDDDASVRRVLGRFLTGQGCLVSEAADGGAALAALTTGEFDVIVSDISMPVLTGDALWYHARFVRPDLERRWIFVTSGPLPPLLTAAQQPRLAKPLELDALWQAVCARVPPP
jgi:CheY-like chemotaxis protein